MAYISGKFTYVWGAKKQFMKVNFGYIIQVAPYYPFVNLIVNHVINWSKTQLRYFSYTTRREYHHE